MSHGIVLIDMIGDCIPPFWILVRRNHVRENKKKPCERTRRSQVREDKKKLNERGQEETHEYSKQEYIQNMIVIETVH